MRRLAIQPPSLHHWHPRLKVSTKTTDAETTYLRTCNIRLHRKKPSLTHLCRRWPWYDSHSEGQFKVAYIYLNWYCLHTMYMILSYYRSLLIVYLSDWCRRAVKGDGRRDGLVSLRFRRRDLCHGRWSHVTTLLSCHGGVRRDRRHLIFEPTWNAKTWCTPNLHYVSVIPCS